MDFVQTSRPGPDARPILDEVLEETLIGDSWRAEVCICYSAEIEIGRDQHLPERAQAHTIDYIRR